MCGHHRRTSRQETEVRDRSVRASDADRDRTADVLREQAGEGRLEPDELEERLEAAYKAQTLADLDGLVADLPRTERRERPRPAWGWAAAIVPLIAIVAVASVLAGYPMLWLAFPLFFLFSKPYHYRRSAL